MSRPGAPRRGEMKYNWDGNAAKAFEFLCASAPPREKCFCIRIRASLSHHRQRRDWDHAKLAGEGDAPGIVGLALRNAGDVVLAGVEDRDFAEQLDRQSSRPRKIGIAHIILRPGRRGKSQLARIPRARSRRRRSIGKTRPAKVVEGIPKPRAGGSTGLLI